MVGTGGPGPLLVDNAPGSSACPPWVLLLDDPAPRRVLVIGAPDEPAAAWFADAGAKVELWSRPGPATEPVDLIVIGAGALTRRRVGQGMAGFVRACIGSCRTEAAIVAPWAPRPAVRQELARHGFTTVRPIRPILTSSSHRGVGHGFVALRTVPSEAPEPGPAVPERVPSWLAEISSGRSWAPGAGGWTLRVPGAYPSQKAVAVLRPAPGDRPSGVVKITRHPRFNHRLDNEYAQLRGLAAGSSRAAGRAPRALAAGRVAGLAYVVEEALEGRPFLDASRLTADCPLAADAVRTIGDLAAVPARTVRGHDLAERLAALQEEFAVRHRPPTSVSHFLADQIATIADADLPDVVFHGDLGTWNLLVVDGSVRLLDWESAEAAGPPLWDLAYFARSYAVRSGRRRGLDRDRAIGRHLLGTTPLNAAMAGWYQSYAARIDLGPELVEPLFHTCWLHRAVKEAARLADDEPGHYGPLCTRLVHERDAPGLRRLVGR